MSARRKRWVQRPAAPADFANAIACPPVVATLLYQRQQHDPDAVRAFLESDYRTLHDPLLMKGMPEASARIAQAIATGEQMAVYGDYDTDGVTSVALLMQVIPALGGNLVPYIPHRTREGYGLNDEAVDRLITAGTRLLITVDCGISNAHEVARARERGLDVIVTDHHTPPDTLPDAAFAVVNPKQPGCPYPYKQLVGVGIAYKLVQALVRQGLRLPLRGRELLDVVAVGTVTDMGPLNGENRVLVRHGLDALNSTQRPGLRALIEVCGLSQGQLTAGDIGFGLGPRINAAGRLDDAVRSYNLLLASDYAQAKNLAQELNETNRQRQVLTKQVQQQARAQAEAEGSTDDRVVVIAGEGFPAGVVGLVAGRLVEDLGRPVLLLERGEETSVGSARSIPAFNMIEALKTCGDLFVRYGGHSMAAGFTIANDQIDVLRQRLNALASAQLSEDQLVPQLDIDVELPLAALDWDLLRALQMLEPYGQGNPQPVLMARKVRVVSARTVGAERQHLKLQLGDGNGLRPLDAIAFRLGHLAEPLLRHPLIDVAFTLEQREWNGDKSLQINVKDFRRAQ
ncbi:MAG: single-stranded-DNA-specific exonuclease RecJ [Chloroflexales bacterium]|nr:single-stranded-DNA-specific exonuclease RecJ [Chloroflexales bacterium]